MSYVDKIKKAETIYDIQDARVPEATNSDWGKVLTAQEGTEVGSTELVWANAGGGIEYLNFDLSSNENATLQDLVDLVVENLDGEQYGTVYANVKYHQTTPYPSNPTINKAMLKSSSKGPRKGFSVTSPAEVDADKEQSIYSAPDIDTAADYSDIALQDFFNWTGDYRYIKHFALPTLKYSSTSKTYVLKCSSSGSLSWVEENA